MRWPVIVVCTLLLGCPPSEPEPSPPPTGPAEVAGTQAHLDFAADLSDPRFFYRFPFPSDLRLTADGTPDLVGFPNLQMVDVVEGLRRTAALHQGFTVIPVGYFEFTGPIGARAEADVIPAQPDSPILLVDVDPDSPERGRLLPVV